jgi:hypothetical protein
MKPMLYVGATLMIGASIYGFVDYRKTSGKKEFKALYSVPVVEKKEEPATIRTAKQRADVSASAITDTKKPVSAVASTDFVVKKVKKKRTFRRELFSRAPLKDEYYEIKIAEKKEKPADSTAVTKHGD